MKEIEEDTNNWKDSPYSWIGKINCPYLSKMIYGCNAISTKIPMSFFTETEKSMLNSSGTTKDPEQLKQS